MGNEAKVLIVGEDDVGQRLDKWLVSRLEGSSRSQVQSVLKKGLVSIGDKIMRANYRLKLNEEVCVLVEEEKPFGPFAEKLPLDVLYEDEFILAINKPVGMMVHANNHNEKGTLVNALLYYGCPLAEVAGEERPGIVHRLDKNTSGIMLVAKTDEAYFNLVEAFKTRKIEKEYRALVLGELEQKVGEIDVNIDRVGELSKMKAVELGGKESLTKYEVIETFKGISYLKVFPKTGRTHQIRVHLKFIGHSIVCDDLYSRDLKEYSIMVENNSEKKCKRVLLKRHALHAYAIKFEHPISGEKMALNSSLASDFSDVLASLEDGKKRIR